MRTRVRWAPQMPDTAAVIVALALDLIGEPPPQLHPVVWYGAVITWLERHAPHHPRAQFAYGFAILVGAAPFAFLPAWLVERVAGALRTRCDHVHAIHWANVLAALLLGGSLKPFFALRMLADAGRDVRLSLTRGNVPAAREALRSLVSRNRSALSAELVAAAAVESLAENLNDSVIAPLCAYALFGLPGAACYRLVNTCDAMIGYRGKHEYLGKAAARLDDVLNFVPARLTALLIITLAPLFGGNARAAWHIWRRDAGSTASPNAGQPMAAMAGACGIQLEKVGQYTLGDATHSVDVTHIRQAERMVWRVGLLAIVALAGLRGCVTHRGTT